MKSSTTPKAGNWQNNSYDEKTLYDEAKDLDLDALETELAAEDYAVYVERVHRGLYRPSRHGDLIAGKLEAIERGDLKRLMIFMPPRHSKSMTVTETFPSFFIGRNPNRRVIEVSYGDSLARRFGRANKQKIEEHGQEVFGVQLSKTNSTVTNWSLAGYRGGMISVGIGGGITGEGADLLIIDDPIKNRQEADSETYRERLWEEWKNTLRTRLQPGAAVILIVTRWHNDDLAGRLLEQEGEKWDVLSLPAIAEGENDPLDRAEGEPLWPEYGFDEAWAEDTKRTVGSRAWNALYQQRPSPEGGGIFKRSYFRYFQEKENVFLLHTGDGEIKRIRKDRCRWFQTVDTAMKTKQQNDYTAISTWILSSENELLLYDVHRDRIEVPDQWPLIKRQKYRFPHVLYQAIEDKGSGTGLIQKARREGMPLRILEAETDKVTRSFDISVMYENGMVYHKSGAPWLPDYEAELLAFPNGEHDDQVDTASYAGKEVNGNHIGIRVIGDDDDDLDDELDDLDDEDFDGWDFEVEDDD